MARAKAIIRFLFKWTPCKKRTNEAKKSVWIKIYSSQSPCVVQFSFKLFQLFETCESYDAFHWLLEIEITRFFVATYFIYHYFVVFFFLSSRSVTFFLLLNASFRYTTKHLIKSISLYVCVFVCLWFILNFINNVLENSQGNKYKSGWEKKKKTPEERDDLRITSIWICIYWRMHIELCVKWNRKEEREKKSNFQFPNIQWFS